MSKIEYLYLGRFFDTSELIENTKKYLQGRLPKGLTYKDAEFDGELTLSVELKKYIDLETYSGREEINIDLHLYREGYLTVHEGMIYHGVLTEKMKKDARFVEWKEFV